jgi:hypothetical protein
MTQLTDVVEMHLDRRKRTVMIWGLIGCVVPIFWGVVSFIFFNARESIWTTIYWYTVYATCPSWLLPETDFSWLVTPLLNGVLYAGIALSISAVTHKKEAVR